MNQLEYFPEEIKEHYLSFLVDEKNYNDINKNQYNLFCAWVHLFDVLINEELLEKIINDKNNIKLISENILENFDIICSKNKLKNTKIISIKNKIINSVLKIIFYLDTFMNFHFTNVRIHGAEIGWGINKYINIIKMNLLKNRLSKYEYKNVEFNKNKFIELLISKNIFLDKKIFECLPKVLFADTNNNLKEYTIHGCALELLANPFYNLYLHSKFTFIPFIHGAGYYEWNDNMCEELEFILSGSLPKWEKVKVNNIIKLSEKINIFVALRRPVELSYYGMFASESEHLKDQGNCNLLLEIAIEEGFFIRPSPRGVNNIYDESLICKSTINYELNNSTLFIFDALSSTLAYRLIERNIPFIYIFKNIKFNKLSRGHIKFLDIMTKAGGLIVSSNKTEITTFINMLKNKNFLIDILAANKKIYDIDINDFIYNNFHSTTLKIKLNQKK